MSPLRHEIIGMGEGQAAPLPPVPMPMHIDTQEANFGTIMLV